MIKCCVDRGLNAQVSCMYNVVKSQCGQDIANVFANGYGKLYAGILPNCTIGLQFTSQTICTAVEGNSDICVPELKHYRLMRNFCLLGV